jgi:hypothetical protein
MSRGTVLLDKTFKVVIVGQYVSANAVSRRTAVAFVGHCCFEVGITERCYEGSLNRARIVVVFVLEHTVIFIS